MTQRKLQKRAAQLEVSLFVVQLFFFSNSCTVESITVYIDTLGIGWF
jgi:hypothetical protein